MTAATSVLFTGDDILAGQQVFLKYGLMDNGVIWRHGAYLGPASIFGFLGVIPIAIGTVMAYFKMRYLPQS